MPRLEHTPDTQPLDYVAYPELYGQEEWLMDDDPTPWRVIGAALAISAFWLACVFGLALAVWSLA